MANWQPIHENHAIDVMAAVVTFAQPLPDRILSAVFKACEEAAFAAGLKSRHSTRGLQVTFGPMGMIPGQEPQQGLMFNALHETETGEPIPGRVAEQLQIEVHSIVYRTWRYVSWSWDRERMQSLMTPALKIIAPIVSMNIMRLEYLDRFRFAGPIGDANARGLLRKGTPHVAPSIFDSPTLWHSHVGAFLAPGGDAFRKLQQVNVDALDQPDPDDLATTARWVNITTAREDRYLEAGIADHEINSHTIFKDFDRLHSELKALLSEVISEDLAAKIYLTDQKQ